MKILHQSEATQHKNSDQCTALEYPMGDKDINGAVITINGRYPDAGKVVNRVCKELVYIVSGTGALGIDGQKYPLKSGDLLLILPGEQYYLEGQNLVTFMPCTPAWYPE